MADWNDLSLGLRAYLKTYRWRTIDPVPFTPLRKPLREAKLALVSTAGMVLPSQAPFDDGVRGGDHSFREIPRDAEVAALIDAHRSKSYDHAGIEADKNLAFPLDRLRELEADGVVGLNHRHLSFMGSITAPGRLVRDTAPAASELLARDGVDAALLVPV